MKIMNYLAHIYLSGDNEKLMIGNFIADSIKGKDWKKYDVGIQKGIMLHRAIDHFTDTHEIVKESKKRLWGNYRHYNAVIVDIFYDHFLAKHWNKYHDIDLHVFSLNSYDTLHRNHEVLPDKTKLFFKFMVKNNWLYNYQYIEGIEKVMHGMSRRTSFNSGMEKSTNELEKFYSEFSSEFESFFPLLKQFVESKITEEEFL